MCENFSAVFKGDEINNVNKVKNYIILHFENARTKISSQMLLVARNTATYL